MYTLRDCNLDCIKMLACKHMKVSQVHQDMGRFKHKHVQKWILIFQCYLITSQTQISSQVSCFDEIVKEDLFFNVLIGPRYPGYRHSQQMVNYRRYFRSSVFFLAILEELDRLAQNT